MGRNNCYLRWVISIDAEAVATMYELVFIAEENERSPLHKSVTNAIEYAEANSHNDEGFEVWQVADDANRTRMVMVVSGRVYSGLAHYNKRPA